MAVNSTPSFIKRLSPKNILASGVLVFDALPKNKVRALDYLLDISNASGTIKKTLKLNGMHDDSTAKDTIYARLDNMNVLVELDLVGSNIELKVTNNEGYTISVTALRTLLPT